MIFYEHSNKFCYEVEDLTIGQIYKSGKQNFLLLKIKEVKIETTNLNYAPKGYYFRHDCYCRNTKTGQKVILVPGMFEVPIKEDKFNKIIKISEEDMTDIISGIEEKNIVNYKQYEVYFYDINKENDEEVSLLVETLSDRLRIELSINGDCIIEKNVKKIDFYKKISLKHNEKTYSFQFVETN